MRSLPPRQRERVGTKAKNTREEAGRNTGRRFQPPREKRVSSLQCRSLKLELDDARASCELQKARVKDLVARKVSTILDDSGGGGVDGDNAVAAAPDQAV